ncbi:MAG TPA: hypothetical protein VIH57_01145 [Bacteroidales bacterium]
MKCIFKYIFVLVIGVFFLLSACEISTKYFTNTFDDEYDVYVLPDSNNLPNIAIDFIADHFQFKNILLPAPADNYILYFKTDRKCETRISDPPLYLSYRILLI